MHVKLADLVETTTRTIDRQAEELAGLEGFAELEKELVAAKDQSEEFLRFLEAERVNVVAAESEATAVKTRCLALEEEFAALQQKYAASMNAKEQELRNTQITLEEDLRDRQKEVDALSESLFATKETLQEVENVLRESTQKVEAKQDEMFSMEAAFNESELHFGVKPQLQLEFSTSTWDLSKCVNIFDFGNEGPTQPVPLS